MNAWRRDLQYAAIGMAAAAAVDLLADRRRGESRSGARICRLLLAGGVAAVYAHLVPASIWGVRSGAAFAQLPIVVSAHRRLHPATPPLNLAIWGALTGWGLHALRLEPPAAGLARR